LPRAGVGPPFIASRRHRAYPVGHTTARRPRFAGSACRVRDSDLFFGVRREFTCHL